MIWVDLLVDKHFWAFYFYCKKQGWKVSYRHTGLWFDDEGFAHGRSADLTVIK